MSKSIIKGNSFFLQINFPEKIKFSLSEASQIFKFINERESENISNKLSELKNPSSGLGFAPNKVYAKQNTDLMIYKEIKWNVLPFEDLLYTLKEDYNRKPCLICHL